MAINTEAYHQLLAKISGKARLIAVTKNRSIDDINELYQLGQRDFGENRVPELLEKSQAMADKNDIRWHFIGRLQTNKVSKLLSVSGLKAIHSVDSERLLAKIASELEKKKRPEHDKLGFFIQINTSGEEQKAGLYPELASMSFLKTLSLPLSMVFQGLMTMSSIRGDDFKQDALDSFASLKQLKDALQVQSGAQDIELSMGMSQDFEQALEQGSDWLRVGSLLFKE
jgi:pyridoxal phosphate enzyme (YggS family)